MLPQYVLRGALHAVAGSRAIALCGTGNSVVDLFEAARDWRDDRPGDIGCFESVRECETYRTANQAAHSVRDPYRHDCKDNRETGEIEHIGRRNASGTDG